MVKKKKKQEASVHSLYSSSVIHLEKDDPNVSGIVVVFSLK